MNGHDLIVGAAALRGELLRMLLAFAIVLSVATIIWAFEEWRQR